MLIILSKLFDFFEHIKLFLWVIFSLGLKSSLHVKRFWFSTLAIVSTKKHFVMVRDWTFFLVVVYFAKQNLSTSSVNRLGFIVGTFCVKSSHIIHDSGSCFLELLFLYLLLSKIALLILLRKVNSKIPLIFPQVFIFCDNFRQFLFVNLYIFIRFIL